ncbi:MAG: hypothetical protein JWP86_2337, partial [Phenylobacterium sp.]|nr:hypothetical protein [Phenylobacterium sp.]
MKRFASIAAATAVLIAGVGHAQPAAKSPTVKVDTGVLVGVAYDKANAFRN